jgi:hypothetical protein
VGVRISEVSRELLWTLMRQGGSRAVCLRAELVSYSDAVEVEVHSAGTLVARWRFVRDVAARVYGARLQRELELHGYRPRRYEPREEWDVGVVAWSAARSFIVD